MQISLLRVLQEKEFERVGGNRTIRTDVRVIAATNRNLEREVADGRFRMDLYYRLNVFPVHVPSLRERSDDIPILVDYFAARLASRMGKRIREIDKQTLDTMQRYLWPGNIRELQNVIERGVILADGEVFRLEPGTLTQEFPSGLFYIVGLGRSARRSENRNRSRSAGDTGTDFRTGRCSRPPGIAGIDTGVTDPSIEDQQASVSIGSHDV